MKPSLCLLIIRVNFIHSEKWKCAPSPNHGSAYFGMQSVGDGRSGRSYRDHQHKPHKPQKPLLMCEMCGYKGHTKV